VQIEFVSHASASCHCPGRTSRSSPVPARPREIGFVSHNRWSGVWNKPDDQRRPIARRVRTTHRLDQKTLPPRGHGYGRGCRAAHDETRPSGSRLSIKSLVCCSIIIPAHSAPCQVESRSFRPVRGQQPRVRRGEPLVQANEVPIRARRRDPGTGHHRIPAPPGR
jgi:hypothetical protein